MIRLERVCRTYGSGPAQVRALDRVDLVVEAGEFVAVTGPSGSGKSTCLHLIGCLDTPTSGTYWFRGVDAGRLDRDRRALLRRHFIGFVFQSFQLLPRTSALENVALPLLYQSVAPAERRRRALAALERVGLLPRASHVPAELSGGEQQRVAIARAIVTEPSLLLADEPTGNLDTARAHQILDLLAALNEERDLTVILVTHEQDIAARTRRIIGFRDGRIELDRATAEAS